MGPTGAKSEPRPGPNPADPSCLGGHGAKEEGPTWSTPDNLWVHFLPSPCHPDTRVKGMGLCPIPSSEPSGQPEVSHGVGRGLPAWLFLRKPEQATTWHQAGFFICTMG